MQKNLKIINYLHDVPELKILPQANSGEFPASLTEVNICYLDKCPGPSGESPGRGERR